MVRALSWFPSGSHSRLQELGILGNDAKSLWERSQGSVPAGPAPGGISPLTRDRDRIPGTAPGPVSVPGPAGAAPGPARAPDPGRSRGRSPLSPGPVRLCRESRPSAGPAATPPAEPAPPGPRCLPAASSRRPPLSAAPARPARADKGGGARPLPGPPSPQPAPGGASAARPRGNRREEPAAPPTPRLLPASSPRSALSWAPIGHSLVPIGYFAYQSNPNHTRFLPHSRGEARTTGAHR